MTEPAVATAAYSYQGLRWLAARIAVRISGPPNVGSGELSKMARKKSPNAPKWRNIDVTLCPPCGMPFWTKMFNTNSIYQLRRRLFPEQSPLSRTNAPEIRKPVTNRRKCLQSSHRNGFPWQGQSQRARKVSAAESAAKAAKVTLSRMDRAQDSCHTSTMRISN